MESKKKTQEKKIKREIDIIMKKYSEEYAELAEKSEDLFDAQEKLCLAYEKLNNRTGLNELFEQLAEIKEAKNGE